MTWQPYCGAAPSAAELLSRWNLDPVLLLCLFALVSLHAAGLARAGISIHDRKIKYFSTVWLLVFALFISPLCALTSALFSVRVAHHVILIAVVAPLFVLSLPDTVRTFRSPAPITGFIAALHACIVWYWHAPASYAAALGSHAIFWTMELSLLLSAVLLWAALLSVKNSAGEVLPALLASVIQMGLLGALITFARAPLYAPHFGTTEMWGMSALGDQQLAGLLMWVPAAIPYLFAALTRLSSLFEESTTGRAS